MDTDDMISFIIENLPDANEYTIQQIYEFLQEVDYENA